ncbi:hypothetical protein ZHAS_00003294 [Anopheles sinensis]|uniref:Uncharacterized protein n=1 Tax=Anopheles sinensis TaxID=74873 RepID=A0A084VE09_ANOSI|nr:hypothetical protein ZHAS_00003294 [Anopheles sinensis]
MAVSSDPKSVGVAVSGPHSSTVPSSAATSAPANTSTVTASAASAGDSSVHDPAGTSAPSGHDMATDPSKVQLWGTVRA